MVGGNHPIVVQKTDKIFVAGHRGLVGSALIRKLKQQGFCNLLTRDHSQLDLRHEAGVDLLFAEEKPNIVILAAARVGGIKANADLPVEFLLENLQMQNNVIRSAHKAGVGKLLFLGSSCIYPKYAPQPIPETALLSGPLEPTNESYAIAKIAGIKLCQAYARQYGANFISLMPTNLYGSGDNFDLLSSHVLPALLRKAHEAKKRGDREMIVWGSGKPRREFLHVDDLADACLFLLEKYDSPEIINVGCGEDISIRELAELICEIVGFKGDLAWAFDKGRFAESIAVLKEAGLPKQEFQNMGQVFKKDGLVSSPMQERAQMIFALSQELSRTVSEIDGVLSARVHLVLPENDPLRQQLVPSSASVFIRHRSSTPVGNLVPQVKMLVANGVAGLSYDKVSVVLVPVDSQKASQGQDLEMVSFFGVWMQRDNLAQAMWMFFGLVAVVVLLAGALAFVVFRQRGRVYALGSPRAVTPTAVSPVPSNLVNAPSSNVVKAGSSSVVKAS